MKDINRINGFHNEKLFSISFFLKHFMKSYNIIHFYFSNYYSSVNP